MLNDFELTIDLLQPIFRDVFDADNLVLERATCAHDIEGWDSLAQIRLVIAIEKTLSLKLSSAEISNLSNVGDMVDLIVSKRLKNQR
jgi:acyl carrier protein